MDQKEVNFYDLSSKEQINSLEQTFNTISQKIYSERNAEIISGKIELMDISYNTTSDGQVVYDLKIKDVISGEELHEFYNEDLNKIDLSKEKIEAFKALGSDTKEMEDELKELEGLKDNPDKVSLSELKSMDKEIDNISSSLGISKDEVVSSTKLDANHNLKIDEKSLNGTSVSANEKVSTHYNLRDVLGGDYVSYQIIKTTNGNYKLMGVDKDGFAEEIKQDKVELINDSQAITLTQENGNSKEANMIIGFRVKSKISDIDNDQIIGLCNDGRSELTAFYGRGALSQDKIVAENIPAKTYNGYRTRQEKLMDTKMTDLGEFNSVGDLVERVAEEQQVDSDTLRDEVMNKYNNYDNITEENIRAIAIDLARTEPLPPERSNVPKDQH